jgi:hypothetical protein
MPISRREIPRCAGRLPPGTSRTFAGLGEHFGDLAVKVAVSVARDRHGGSCGRRA